MECWGFFTLKKTSYSQYLYTTNHLLFNVISVLICVNYLGLVRDKMRCSQLLYILTLLLCSAFFSHNVSANIEYIDSHSYLESSTISHNADLGLLTTPQRYRFSSPTIKLAPLYHECEHFLALLQQKSNVFLSFTLVPIEKSCLKRKNLLSLANFQFRFTHSRNLLFS